MERSEHPNPPHPPGGPGAPPRVRIGYAPEARQIFDRLAPKEKNGLRRKLQDFGANPSIGKPLTGDLLGYHRVTLGRLRTIAEAIARVVDGVVIVHVLHIGIRKAGDKNDPYEIAAARAIEAQDPEAMAALESMLRHVTEPGEEGN